MTQDTIPAQLEEINDRLDAGDKRMHSIETQVAENTALTRENTEITKDIKELLDAARLGFKVLGGLGVAVKWLGGVAAAAVALYSAWHQWWKP